MNITYRTIEPREAKEFWNMMNSLDSETKYMMYEPGERQEKANNISRLAATIESANSGSDFLIVAECEHQMIGYLWAQRGYQNRIKHSAYIVTGIRKTYQGLGIGTEFFHRLDCWAAKQNVSRLELTVMCPNKIAIHLYEKNGFVIEGTKKNSMIVDGTYMDEYYMAKVKE